VEICPVRVRRKFPDARSHILIVRSPAPLANHSLPGSTARLLTQPRWPDITRINFHGACHSGFGCCTVCFRTRLDDGRFLCGVGLLAFGPPPVPCDRSASAVDVAPFETVSDFAGIPSISLAICESETPSPSAWVLGRFRRAAAEAEALAWLAASAGGSSRTSSYSLRMREVRLARSADSNRLESCAIGTVWAKARSRVVGRVY